LALVALFLVPHVASAKNYVKPDIFKQWLTTNRSLVIVDIQPANNFADHHFKTFLVLECNALLTTSLERRISCN